MTDTDTDINDEESTLDMDMDELASTVVDHMDPGQTIGDKIVLSRRQLMAIAGGGLSLGALASLGVSNAEAQSAVGTIGTASSPVNAELEDINPGSTRAIDFNSNDMTGVSALSTITATIGDKAESPTLHNERVNNELCIRPSGGDLVGSATLHPSGTDDRSHLIVANTSDFENYDALKFELNGGVGEIQAFSKGTGGPKKPFRISITDIEEGFHYTPSDDGANPTRIETYSDGTFTTKQDVVLEKMDGDNTARTLITRPSTVGGFVVVSGATGPAGSKRFSDLVHYGIASPTAFNSQGFGSPGARSYSSSGDEMELSINDAGETYDVSAVFVGGL